ncbi:hypothetical protein, partial [Xanthomonas campestris]|uniref:hypothetical protein n=1 Tax=Xanthomonas campestris TaxID=339 RepID=UPI002B22964D
PTSGKHRYHQPRTLNQAATQGGGTSLLAHSAAFVGAALHFAVLILLTARITHATSAWGKLRNQGKQTPELRQLLQTIVNTAGMSALMLLLAVGAACIPFLMRLVMQLPELGLVFGFLLIALVSHSANINRDARRLRDPITAAERSAQRTMAA